MRLKQNEGSLPTSLCAITSPKARDMFRPGDASCERISKRAWIHSVLREYAVVEIAIEDHTPRRVRALDTRLLLKRILKSPKSNPIDLKSLEFCFEIDWKLIPT